MENAGPWLVKKIFPVGKYNRDLEEDSHYVWEPWLKWQKQSNEEQTAQLPLKFGENQQDEGYQWEGVGRHSRPVDLESI